MGIIFDLDQTIIDSSIAYAERHAKDWHSVYKLIPSMRPYHRIVSFIKLAVNMGIKVAVVTSSPRPYCEKVLEYMDITGVITVCWHDTMRHKPDPEPLLLAIDKMGNQEGKKIIVIGDEESDIIAANKIDNVISAWAYWGNRKDMIDSAVRPDVYFQHERTLLSFFTSHGLDTGVCGMQWRAEGIYYLYDYYPISRKHDVLSYDLFQEVKGFSNKKIILRSFCKCIKTFNFGNNYGIFVVPSSQCGKWNEALVNYVVPRLETEIGLIDCSDYLYRYKTHEKQAYGGDRSIQSHLNSIKVRKRIPNRIDGAIIIDDITTTGNIFNACRELLVDQGVPYENIYCFAVGGTV